MPRAKRKKALTALSIVGARPQFIKLQPIHNALIAKKWHHIIVHTGQHYDDRLSRQFFKELRIPKPDLNLGVGSGSHGYQTGRVMERLDDILQQARPDVVIVYGDTNATVAGALAAEKLHIPVAHIEAGMRSYNREMPEEINRVATDHVATYHFCANFEAKKNLRREGISNHVFVVGDVMIDVLRQLLPKIPKRQSKPYALVTVHRPSNTDDPVRLRKLLKQLSTLRLPVILPAHPRLLARIKAQGLGHLARKESIQFMPAAGYRHMLTLQRNATVIITDSGGIQKEAYYLKIPCITLRKETEWTATVTTGWNTLVKGSLDQLGEKVRSLRRPKGHPSLFGNGDAAQKVIRHLGNALTSKKRKS